MPTRSISAVLSISEGEMNFASKFRTIMSCGYLSYLFLYHICLQSAILISAARESQNLT